MTKNTVPNTTFIFRENEDFVTRTSDDIFSGKNVVLFALPGAYTPTCSNYQLPQFDSSYSKFKELGIDEVYCLSVNDAFVMNAWAKDQNIQNVKMLPDGNGSFTRLMGMEVTKLNLGFGSRSWRYAAVINNGIIERLFVEPGKVDEASGDPYVASSPDAVIQYLEYVKNKQ